MIMMTDSMCIYRTSDKSPINIKKKSMSSAVYYELIAHILIVLIVELEIVHSSRTAIACNVSPSRIRP